MRWDKKKNISSELENEQTESELIGESLTMRQEKFCQLYALDTRFMGSWVQAYAEAYWMDKTSSTWYNTAKSNACRLLTNAYIYGRINDLLEEEGLNDQFVDKQLLYVISQHDDKSNKIAAIKEYNKLKQRITEKIEHSGKVSFSDFMKGLED